MTRDDEAVIPDGFVTVAELAELAECSCNTARNRIHAAGCEYRLIPRVNAAGVLLGARKLMVVPQREGLYAVLKR